MDAERLCSESGSSWDTRNILLATVVKLCASNASLCALKLSDHELKLFATCVACSKRYLSNHQHLIDGFTALKCLRSFKLKGCRVKREVIARGGPFAFEMHPVAPDTSCPFPAYCFDKHLPFAFLGPEINASRNEADYCLLIVIESRRQTT